MPRPALSLRSGMTIIEVMFAVVILAGVMLALSRFGQAFTRATRDAANLGIASDLATARLETIRAYPVYDSLEAVFEGDESPGAANPPMDGFDGFTRRTDVTRRTTAPFYTTVTVTVNGAALRAPVRKSVDIAAP